MSSDYIPGTKGAPGSDVAFDYIPPGKTAEDMKKAEVDFEKSSSGFEKDGVLMLKQMRMRSVGTVSEVGTPVPEAEMTAEAPLIDVAPPIEKKEN